MEIRAFKTYSKYYGYLSFHLLPVIGYEGFKEGDKTIFISWLVWALQIKWTN